MTTAAISQLVLPLPLASSLLSAVATGQAELVEYTAALLGGQETASQRTRLLGQVIAIENLRASAVFEDGDILDRSDALRRLDVALLGIVDVAQLLGRSLDWLDVISPLSTLDWTEP